MTRSREFLGGCEKRRNAGCRIQKIFVPGADHAIGTASVREYAGLRVIESPRARPRVSGFADTDSGAEDEHHEDGQDRRNLQHVAVSPRTHTTDRTVPGAMPPLRQPFSRPLQRYEVRLHFIPFRHARQTAPFGRTTRPTVEDLRGGINETGLTPVIKRDAVAAQQDCRASRPRRSWCFTAESLMIQVSSGVTPGIARP